MPTHHIHKEYIMCMHVCTQQAEALSKLGTGQGGFSPTQNSTSYVSREPNNSTQTGMSTLWERRQRGSVLHGVKV